MVKIPEVTAVKSGKLKTISIEIKNPAKKTIRIKPNLISPANWRLLIPLEELTLKPLQKRKLNIFLQVPNDIKAGPRLLNFKLKVSDKIFNNEFKINIKEYKELKIKAIDIPRYVKDQFNVKFSIINQGNTTRKLKIYTNKFFTVKERKIVLKPLTKKIINIRCKSKTELTDPYLIIRAKDQDSQTINLVSEKIKIVHSQKKLDKYKGHFKYSYFQSEPDSINKAWFLSTKLRQNINLKISNEKFNLQQNRQTYQWQLGTDYDSIFKLARSSSDSNLRFSYLKKNKKDLKSGLYTDFNSELGATFNYFNDHLNIYLESKKRWQKSLQYYFKIHYGNQKNKIAFTSHKKKSNDFKSIKLTKQLNKRNSLEFEYSSYAWWSTLMNKKRVCYTYHNKDQKIRLEYKEIFNQEDRQQRFKIQGSKYNSWRNFDQQAILSFKNNRSSLKIESLKYRIRNQKYHFSLKKHFLTGDDKLSYRLTKILKKDQITARISLDNYGKNEVNLGGQLNYQLKNDLEITLNGSLNINEMKEITDQQISLAVFIPFTVKIFSDQSQAVQGKLVTAEGKPVRGAVLSLIDQTVKTDEKGHFKYYPKQKEDLMIKALDLGCYEKDYVIDKSSIYLISNYDGKSLTLKLIKYGSLKIDIKKATQNENKYFKSLKIPERGKTYIKLYNKDNYFVKKYQGETELKFTGLPPGEYRIAVETNTGNYIYHLEKRRIKISSGQNLIQIKEKVKNKPHFDFKEGLEEIKIKN